MSLHFVAFLRRYKRALNISRRSVFLGLVCFVILSRRERMTENCSSLRSDVYLVMEQLDYNILLRNISILGEWAKDIRQVLRKLLISTNLYLVESLFEIFIVLVRCLPLRVCQHWAMRIGISSCTLRFRFLVVICWWGQMLLHLWDFR